MSNAALGVLVATPSPVDEFLSPNKQQDLHFFQPPDVPAYKRHGRCQSLTWAISIGDTLKAAGDQVVLKQNSRPDMSTRSPPL